MLPLRLSMGLGTSWSIRRMIDKLRKKLILLYTLTTGIILTVVLILVLVVISQQTVRNKKDTFQNEFMTVTQNFSISNEVSNLWLAEMETKSHLIIHIEDGGQPLWYKGAWKPVTDREVLISRLKEAARLDDINMDIRPVSVKEIRSRIYELKGDGKDKYFGQVYVAAVQDGYRSVAVLQYIAGNRSETVRQGILIALLYLSGMTGLYLVSRWVVGKSVKPVEESRRRQTEFIAAASHELKSPLAVIRANTSAITIEPERADDFTKGIDKECVRLSALIEDLLLLASADAKNWKVKRELIDMDMLLIETYDSFQPFCREKNKRLKLELPEDMLPKIRGDLLRMKQILAILLDNAVSYTKDNDTITLRSFRKKNQLCIEVEDHGPGIETAKKEDIFERFYKGDKSRGDKSHFGLGLSIARELVQLHEGRISVKDTEGGGVTFSVYLPVCQD